MIIVNGYCNKNIGTWNIPKKLAKTELKKMITKSKNIIHLYKASLQNQYLCMHYTLQFVIHAVDEKTYCLH